MVDIHSTVGTLVILGYLAATVLNVLALTGRSFPWARTVSLAAAGLLLLQYLLGFWLLADGHRNRGSHYILALLPVLTVGLEHGFAPTRSTPRARAATAAAATALTLGLVVSAYLVGESGS